MGTLQEECMDLIKGYTALCNTKLQRMARQHMKRFGRVSLCRYLMLDTINMNVVTNCARAQNISLLIF